MVAMSGGVDSSAAAVLLKEQGYELCGATLRLFSNERIGIEDQTRTCCSLADVLDARSVAYKLGFEHHAFNFGPVFEQMVIRRFADGYEKGITPNPCIDCNRYIKFGLLLERARLLGYDGIATGHYARSEYQEASGRWVLRKAKDPAKDQSYVLYAMTQDELAHTCFPLGGLAKSEVRGIAQAHGLVNAQKPDSQDICFVTDGDYAGFLENIMKVQSFPGNFVDREGTVLGRHKGLIHYTIGQRKGLGICLPEPRYVVEKDPDSNTVILGRHEELFSNELVAGELNWIAVQNLEEPMEVRAKTRYRQVETPAVISPLEAGRVLVRFLQPQRAITPGQAVVFYQGDIVVGGGTILRKSDV